MTDEETSDESVAASDEAKPAKKTKPKLKRLFPKHSIEESRKIAEAIKQFNAGNPWSPADIAKSLKTGGKSNEFYYLTAASRDYGLTVGTRDTDKIELAPLGKQLVYPKIAQEEADAVGEAFRNVELFKKVLDYYQGQNLPDIQYLKNTLKVEFGVPEELQDEFYELYQQNLTYWRSFPGTNQAASKLPAVAKGASPDTIILGESKNSGSLVAFVAMPFSEKSGQFPKGYFDEVLKHLITPAAVNAGFNARTAKRAGSEVIQATIVNDLDSADLVIVDLTEHNPNVLFELGLRMAFNKPVCLIRARGTLPIFDIDHMLRVYDYNSSLWQSTLAIDVPSLTEHIQETWKQRESDRSYLSILRESH